MVREARFSWDDIERLDPALRNERPDDFDGPDDDWVQDLKQTTRRRNARKRRRRKPARRDRTSGQADTAPPHAEKDPRRHLSGADWLDLQRRDPPRREAPAGRRGDEPANPPGPPFPGEPWEHTDDAA